MKRGRGPREHIAHMAARLMAEDGISDFSMAKRKAARQLGYPESAGLPANTEVEAALRDYQSIFQGEEQADRLHCLREEAVAFMRLLEEFNPYLIGSVLSGTAGRHSDINLHLYTDDQKAVEYFLIGRGLAYRSSARRFRFPDAVRTVPIFEVPAENAAVQIAVFSTDDLRLGPRDPVDGKAVRRAGIAAVEEMIGRG